MVHRGHPGRRTRADRTGYAWERARTRSPKHGVASTAFRVNFDGDTNVIDVAVGRLRRKIDDNFAIKLIHTVRGVGYVLEKRE